jgi:hypothetical protein
MNEGLGTEQETQGEGYNIEREPLFDKYDTALDDQASNEADTTIWMGQMSIPTPIPVTRRRKAKES